MATYRALYGRGEFAHAADGTRIYCESFGDQSAPALVLADGIGCDGFAWRHMVDTLGQRFRLIHFHYRGHGRSGEPKDVAQIDILAHARDLYAVLNHFGIERACLMGHSMGTQVLLEAYRLAPQRVDALMLVCGSYGKITSTFHGSDMLARVLPDLIARVSERPGLVRALWGRMPPRISYRIAVLSGEVDRSTLREEDFVWYIDHVAQMNPELFLGMLKAAGDHSAEDLLGSISKPTLVVAAERDTFAPPNLGRFMAEKIPAAELLELRNASHAAPVEQPDVICARLQRFCEQHHLGK